VELPRSRDERRYRHANPPTVNQQAPNQRETAMQGGAAAAAAAATAERDARTKFAGVSK